MASTTIGVKIDDALRLRLKAAADRMGRSSHWLIKQAIHLALERAERGEDLTGLEPGAPEIEESDGPLPPLPFLEFAQNVQPQTTLRARITAAYRRPETECLPLLISRAALSATQSDTAQAMARQLVQTLRAKARARSGGVEALIHEYSLSSQEGVALMCLAEALLRIPDRATRDALIRDKIGHGDWQAHLGHSPSLFVNAATWGLLVTGKLTATSSEAGLSSALTRLIAAGGEPLIRSGVDMAMRLMGEQFVSGQTIAEALANGRRFEARGFRYSYDMLGEAAMTAEDAARYYADYERAIHAIGKAAARRGIYEGPGISVKLSALHPRYSRAQRERVMGELLPRLKALTLLALRYDIGLNIDAEEADRLELSLDLLESLCFDPELSGWNGIGFVVQAYQKRAPFVIDYLIDLGRRSGHRLMIRLVKGAYWDSEIKRAQVDGLEGFPVFTRKLHTDVSYLACAKMLLAAPDAAYPQFATHNAQTLSAIHAMAGGNYYSGQYEFQCLHGMGEPLYEEVVGPDKLNRPCRIYAPVGTHETLLAYLVRRLLENGANTSFVNQIADPDIPLENLIADPVKAAQQIQPIGAPHPRIAQPRALFGSTRANSAGLDLSNEQALASLSAALLAGVDARYTAMPDDAEGLEPRPVRNPADHRDVVGQVAEATPETVARACDIARRAAMVWQSTPVDERAAILRRAADIMEARMPSLMGLIVREAGKSLPNAISEIREAVDFLRYYAAEGERTLSNDTHRPLGAVACISPWNFPLAIFTGQVAAALMAGNTVLAKPAPETPLTAAQAVSILREAGLPPDALLLLPGSGETGGALVNNPAIAGVIFTGSTATGASIHRALGKRLGADGRPIPLIAETGGQNVLIVDSSALPEQVVADVLQSAFDSAGQRCSALRVLCLQEDIADRVLAMLHGAMAELRLGTPDHLSCDIGPVITAKAQRGIQQHVTAMRAKGRRVHELPLPDAARHGTFVAPTLIEIDALDELQAEVFGPVLHVMRYKRSNLDKLVDAINAAGYGLTFGIHSRIDETIEQVSQRISAGNIYVNRNLIGAVVGVQPFGGHGLSGTGPKAGGPLYLARLLSERSLAWMDVPAQPAPLLQRYIAWLDSQGQREAAARCRAYGSVSLLGLELELPGPVGERNVYHLRPKGRVLCVASMDADWHLQLGAAFATGNHVLLPRDERAVHFQKALPHELAAEVALSDSEAGADAILFAGDADALLRLVGRVAALEGPRIPVFALSGRGPNRGDYPLENLLHEVSVSTNTAAAGGNASLMTIG